MIPCLILLCSQILFKWKNTGCSKEHLHTLMSGEWVEGNVIDIWTHILNHRESRRSESSPHRLFCTIDSTVCQFFPQEIQFVPWPNLLMLLNHFAAWSFDN